MSFCFARRLPPQFVVQTWGPILSSRIKRFKFQSLSRYFWVLSLGSNLPSAFQKLLVNTGWKYILKRIHVKIFWSPFHSKSGPHFEQLRSPSHVGAVTLILSVFSYIVFTFLYSYIVVYVHFLPGPMTQGILCQGSLVCCFVKNACQ